MGKFSKYVNTGEETNAVLLRHPGVYTWRWIVGSICLALAFFFLWPFLKLGSWGALGFGTTLGVGLYVLLKTLRLWRGTFVITTPERLVDVVRLGWWGEAVSQIKFRDIQDISWTRQGFGSLIYRYGTVHIVGAQGAVRLALPALPQPESVAVKLIAAAERARGEILPHNGHVSEPLTKRERDTFLRDTWHGQART